MMPQRLTKEVMKLYEKHVRRRDISIGSVMQALHNKGGLPLIEWIADNTPQGVTVCEVLASMAMDEMLDDTQPIAKKPHKAVFKSVRTKP